MVMNSSLLANVETLSPVVIVNNPQASGCLLIGRRDSLTETNNQKNICIFLSLAYKAALIYHFVSRKPHFLYLSKPDHK